MRKLLLLLCLIPVLSWADYTPERSKSYDLKGVETTQPEHYHEYDKNEHIEMHRCAALNQLTPTCICENLGGLIEIKNNDFFCNAGIFSDGSVGSSMNNLQLPHFKVKPIISSPAKTTPTATPTVSIKDAKSQCSDIGFKKGTEKFGDCVLELMQ